jgi:hypothetical protein
MGVGIAEIDEQTVTEQLGNVSIKALNDFRASTLVCTDDFSILFGIELGGEFGGIHEVAEHHRELPSFRVGRSMGCRREKCNLRGWLFLSSRWLGSLVCVSGYCLWVTCPDQYRAFFVRGKSFGFDNFVFEVFEILVIEVKSSFQGSIRDTFLPLE